MAFTLVEALISVGILGIFVAGCLTAIVIDQVSISTTVMQGILLVSIVFCGWRVYLSADTSLAEAVGLMIGAVGVACLITVIFCLRGSL